MLKLKEIQTKPVIYQGLAVEVPVDTNYMWLRHNNTKTVLLASAKKPSWHQEHNLYIPPSDATQVAVLEHADLTVEQVKASLETDESLPTDQDLEQLDVVVNLIKNLRGFAKTLECCVAKAKRNPTTENIQALIQHVYAEEGELDTFITNAIEEAEAYGIDTGTDHSEEDEDSVEDHAALLRVIQSILK